MTRTIRLPTEEVVDCLNLRYAGLWNAPLHQLPEPLNSDASSDRDLALSKGAFLGQLVRTLQKVHVAILAKCYPARKQYITQQSWDNCWAWLRSLKNTGGLGSLPSWRVLPPSSESVESKAIPSWLEW